ncbi:MAG: hypothetical protein LC808_13465, partial [Actinobacteria bacterium]|nr:hypothetical protein [Actinomycetota bacterium]
GKGIVMRPEALRDATGKAARAADHKLVTRLSPGEKHGRKRMLRHEALCRIPYRNREGFGGISLGLMAYPAPKGQPGTTACQITNGRAQAYGATCWGTRRDMAKAGLLES